MPRDEEFIARLIELEASFWNKVLSGERPEIDGSETSTKILNKLFPQSKPEEIALPSKAEELIKAYYEARDEMEIAALKKQAAENALKEMLGESERGTLGNYRVTWKNTSPRRIIDSKKLESERPEIYQAYLKIGKPSRRFEVKGGLE